MPLRTSAFAQILTAAVVCFVAAPASSFAAVTIAASPRTEAPAPPIPGAFTVQTAEYKFPAVVDKDVLTSAPTELWARAFWPTDLSKPLPIIFLLHGNHPTCGQGDPRIDSDCTYTNEGTCPTGQVVTPNHEGYNYLGQQLASLGYIAVTINANRGITCGAGNGADWGLNLARGRLVLRHIEEWMKWATAGGAPVSLGTSADAFLGKIDFTNVGLMGHSRGGEGMRAALTQYRDAGSIWPARIPNLKIRGIFEIASVDGQAGRVLDADDTAWNQLLPMCDGDVSTLDGRLPFERMLKKSTETRKTPKSLTMVYGTNHNFYNSEWKTNDSTECLEHKEVHGPGPVSQNQQTIAATVLSAFMLANVGADKKSEMGRLFDPSYLVPNSLTSITRIDRDHVYTFDRTYSSVVDDFDQATGTSSNHKTNLANGIKITNDLQEIPTRAVVSWTSASTNSYFQLNWSDKGQGRDVSTFTSLDFRVGRPIDDIKETETVFSVQLVDMKGQFSQSVLATKFADITGPGNTVDLYQTVRLPISQFGLTSGTKIRGVRFVFDHTPKASLYFATVRFTSDNPVAFAGSMNEALAPQPIVIIPKEDEGDEADLMKAAPVATPAPSATLAPLVPNETKATSEVQAIVSSAVIFKVRSIANSKYLAGQTAVEISVGSMTHVFPVEAQLPTLVMSGNRFSVSRYPNTGKIDSLTFSIPREDFDSLPLNGSMHVQYGRTNARKFWRLPNYNKSELLH